MAILTRDQILKADDRRTVEVEVPEWGGSVLIRSLTGAERDKFEASTMQNKGGKQVQNYANFRARLVSLCIVNEQGELLFNSADIKLLGDKSVAALQRVFNKCNELNGLSDEDVEEMTSVFDGEAREASTSDSH
jgi:hypothetical protein